jgi:hypothetical protein
LFCLGVDVPTLVAARGVAGLIRAAPSLQGRVCQIAWKSKCYAGLFDLHGSGCRCGRGSGATLSLRSQVLSKGDLCFKKIVKDSVFAVSRCRFYLSAMALSQKRRVYMDECFDF